MKLVIISGVTLQSVALKSMLKKTCALKPQHRDCQMVYFRTKIPNLSKFRRASQTENVGIFYDCLEHFTAIWYRLGTFGIV
jgi:hypothetical protein